MPKTLAQIARANSPHKHFRNGGYVRGPGTGTSDSIDAKLSAGEFILPDDTVRKVGVRRLQDLVHETHDPVPTKGKRHYANGGLVDDKPKRPNRFDNDAFIQSMEQQRAAATQASQAAGQAAMAEAEAVAQQAADAKRGSTLEPASAPALTAGSSGSPESKPLSERVAQIPSDGQTAPAPDGSQSSWMNTEAGRNLSNIASALPGSLGGAIPAVIKTGGAISGGIDAATRLLGAGAGAAAVSALPSSAAERTSATSTAGAGRGIVNPLAANPLAPPPVSPPAAVTAPSTTDPATTSNVTRVGNSYSGTNVAGDITINGNAPRSGGQISAQNMAAADNLATSQSAGARERLLAAGTTPTQGVQAPVVRHSGNDWQSRNDLRNLEVSASSIKNLPEWQSGSSTQAWSTRGSTAKGDPLGKIAAYQSALAADIQRRGEQPTFDMAAARENASIQRESMQQAGETQRTDIRAQGVNDANQIARGRLSLEQVAAGYQNRASDRLDRAQVALESAATPEAQRTARERLLALAGKAPQNEWGLQVTPTTKNLDGSTTQGSVYRYNKTTGETARVDEGQGASSSRVSSQAQFDALPKGATYIGADGRTYRKPS